MANLILTGILSSRSKLMTSNNGGRLLWRQAKSCRSALDTSFMLGCHSTPYFYSRTLLLLPSTAHFGTFQNSTDLRRRPIKILWRGFSTDSAADSKSGIVKTHSSKPAVGILKFFVKLYDILTLPLYTLIQQPKRTLSLHNQIKGVRVPGSTNEWQSVLPRSARSQEIMDHKIDTLEKLFDHTMTTNAAKDCLGSRPILSQDSVIETNGQIMKKWELGEYKWKSYGQVQKICTHLSHQMTHSLGLRSKETIAIFADTREEWLMTAIAAFKSNLAIATIFTALTEDGVVHALNETEVGCLFTSDDLMPRCYDILKRTPTIKTIVYMDRVVLCAEEKFEVDMTKIPEGVNIISMSSLLAGLDEFNHKTAQTPKPGPHDTAVIMYTSGSTGVPKGVILSHLNAVSVLMGMADALSSLAEDRDDECYMAVLPLAHILELSSEANTFLHGAKIGYGSPYTITDASPGLKEGTKGDATVLQPTVLAVVPLVLERLSKAVQTNLDKAGGLVPDLFEFFTKYKMDWIRRGYRTPLLDRTFFKMTRKPLGGKVRIVVVGGAHLAPQTQELVRTILCSPVIVGYGLTESAGCASCCIAEDLSVGRAGSPIHACTLKLVDWEEGGYRVTDRPHPRGELYLGGDSVANNYFKRESDDFFTQNGKRWFKSGDIAEIHDDGVIKIIDRKKDLVKLVTGKFISLGRIEAVLKTSRLVENICVCAHAALPVPVAIIVPSEIEINKLAKKLKIHEKNFQELTQDEKIVEEFLTSLQDHGKLHKLIKSETPQLIHLSPTPWTPQSGLVTASLKVKRVNIHSQFKAQLEKLYSKLESAKL